MTDFALPPNPTLWVMAGDSITQGVLHTYGARCWVEHVHERLRWQLDRFFDTIINSGMSSWTAKQVAESFDHLIGRYRPQIVSVSLGTNDCRHGPEAIGTFEASMQSIIEASRKLGAIVVLQTPVLVMHSAPPDRRDNLALYTQKVRELAQSHECPLVDHAAYWTAHFKDAEPVGWMDDHSHPNAIGHAQMAQHMLETLKIGKLEDLAIIPS